MMRIENRCCGCAAPAYPCLGSSCSMRKYEAHYCDNCGCDNCGEELDEIYVVDDMELCENRAEETDNG